MEEARVEQSPKYLRNMIKSAVPPQLKRRSARNQVRWSVAVSVELQSTIESRVNALCRWGVQPDKERLYNARCEPVGMIESGELANCYKSEPGD